MFDEATSGASTGVLNAQSHESSRTPPIPASKLFLTAVWFALAAGFVEGATLLIFQRVNWAEWARVLHVSKEILWISPVVDLCFFLLIAFGVVVLSRIFQRLPAFRLLVFLLVFLTTYDWFLVTGRLYRRACLLLALGIAVALARWLKSHEPEAIRFWRRSTLLLCTMFILVVVAVEAGRWTYEKYETGHSAAAAPGAPNVLVIVVDTLRADHVGSYGYARNTSPEIDKLASSGVLFENAFAPSSWSLPSHASLVTGRPVHEHGLGNVEPMPWVGWGNGSLNGVPTLGEALVQHGYRTGAFSANRIYFTSNVGLGRGFLHFEDYFDSIGDCFVRSQFGREFARFYMNRSEKSKFTRAFRKLGLGRWLDKDSEGSGEYGGAFGIRKRADEVNREALDWIRRDPEHPFFAFLNYLDVHYSYGGPPDDPKPNWDRGTTIEEYDAGLKYVDDNIGRLLRQLEGMGVLRNTVLIITSDHGESLGDHGLSFHGAALYWELLHVPLVISCPGRLPVGVRIEQPVSNAAIAATVLEMIDAKPAIFPGPSLTNLWKQPAIQQGTRVGTGNPNETWPEVISELPQTNTIVKADRAMEGKEPLATNGWMKSIISERWHLIMHEKDGDQIYDWKSDPDELKNLINTPEGRAARALLQPRPPRETPKP